MSHPESNLTPAQRALLDFCSNTDAGSLYKSLSTTLSVSINNFTRHYLEEDMPSSPTEKTLEAWYFTLELMECLHEIAVEERLKTT